MPVGLLSFGRASSVFNGGLSQINLSGANGGDYPFLNVLKAAPFWSAGDFSATATITPDLLDSNGYPTSAASSFLSAHTNIQSQVKLPSQTNRPGNYVIKWDGNGTIYASAAGIATVSGSKTSSGGSGRFVFSLTGTLFNFGVVSVGSPAITNMQCCHVDDEVLLDAGNVFGVKFKERFVEANFGRIRFLNWQDGNITNVTTWNTRKPLGHVFYGGYHLDPNLYCGVTSLVSAAYSASAPTNNSVIGAAWDGVLRDKTTVHVLIGQSLSSACTLNIAGTGDKNILNAYSSALSSGTSSFPVGGSFRSLATLVYDAALDAWIKQGGSLEGSQGILSSIPPELLIRLCKEVGAHPHIVSPGLAVDPITDYMPSLATYNKSYAETYAPWMAPAYEGPNELWNPSGGFYNTGYANAKAAAYSWGSDYHNWYGKVISVLGQAMANVYSIANIGATYHMVCGVQTAGGTTNANPRMLSTKYIASNPGAPQSPYSNTAGVAEAWRWVSQVAIANYYSPLDRFKNQELITAYAYSHTNVGNSAAQAINAESYIDTLAGASGNYNISQNNDYFVAWQAWTVAFSASLKICCYEGGYSPDYLNSNTSWFSSVTAATKNAAGCALTVSANSANGETSAGGIAGNPAVVGMAVIMTGVGGMAELNNPAVRSVTFATDGTGNISGTNTLLLNQAVFFYGGTLPAELTQVLMLTDKNSPGGAVRSIPYYVVSAGNPFKISATRGGAAILFSTAGSSVTAQECWFIKTVAGAGNTTITLDVDSSAFTTYTSSGFASYVNSNSYANNLRYAGKFASNLGGYNTTDYDNLIVAGGVFPSHYLLSSTNLVWPVLDPDVYATNTSAWDSIVAFNN
jgi:hypothetical protein